MTNDAGSPPPPRTGALVAQLSQTLREAAELLQPVVQAKDMQVLGGAEDPTLLEQCLAMCQQVPPRHLEPIRTVHHFACTGGTLISKCLSALPNVQLLSEIDPLSTLNFDPARPEFRPTDMIRQMRQSTRGTSSALLIELFRSHITMVYEDARALGQRLVLRDHAHSHFCSGATIPDRPNLVGLLPPGLPVLSVLTVRHPLDSFSALQRHKWAHFQPFTLEEYCRRYHLFLDSYEGVPCLRYEDFTAQPEQVMQQMCEMLDIPYEEHFQDVYSVFALTGDSGRSGDVIEPRERLKGTYALEKDMLDSSVCASLLVRLGYQ